MAQGEELVMPRYRYGHAFAIVTEQGRMVEIADRITPRRRLLSECRQWNARHATKHYVAKVEMKWKKPRNNK
jgi:hypothetical protein